jgi:hypothetical protein
MVECHRVLKALARRRGTKPDRRTSRQPLSFLKTLKVDKVERFFRHRYTKGLVDFGSFSPIESFGRGEKAPAVVSTSRFRVGEGRRLGRKDP